MPVKKVWDDEDNADGFRPESITVHLLADGEEVDAVKLSED
ncbi:MAG: Cna B-type domain-containing protein, partial [Erysipelotrichales bacterium]|nr:Cna B-type domain-containing protein [Erysipelotrichales bacterium]